MGLYSRILGHPFVYERIRPLIVGGIDVTRAYDRLEAGPGSTVLDVGCGTGDALRYLHGFDEYVGFDIDERAIAAAERSSEGREHATFHCRLLEPADIERIAPTHAVLVGLLHHLDDAGTRDVLSLVRDSARLRRVVTLDPVVLAGEPLSNLLARLDRGRYCRTPEAYVALARGSGFAVSESFVSSSRPDGGRARYFVMVLELDRDDPGS